MAASLPYSQITFNSLPAGDREVSKAASLLACWARIREILSSNTDASNVEAFSIGAYGREDQLARVLEKNTELTIQNTDLQKQVQHLQHVSGGECRNSTSGVLSEKTDDKLEDILQEVSKVPSFVWNWQMREAADRKKELEHEHAEALTQLREKQHETQRLSKLNISSSEKTKSYETIEALQSKIRELEKKAELQNVRHEELLLEMAAIKRSSGSGGTLVKTNSTTDIPTEERSWKATSTNQEVQTSPESGNSTPGKGTRMSTYSTRGDSCGRTMQSLSNMDSHLDSHQLSRNIGRTGCDVAGASRFPTLSFSCTPEQTLNSTKPMMPGYGLPTFTSYLKPSLPLWKSSSVTDLTSSANYNLESSHCISSSTLCRNPCVVGVPNSLPLPPSAASSHQHQELGHAHTHTHAQQTQQPSPGVHPTSASEIDRIMAKIEQDNKILAELDKTRSTIATRKNEKKSVASALFSATLSTNSLNERMCHSHQHGAAKKQYLKVPQITYGRSHQRMGMGMSGSSTVPVAQVPTAMANDPVGYMTTVPMLSQHIPQGSTYQAPFTNMSLPATAQPHLIHHLSQQPQFQTQFVIPGTGNTLIPNILQQGHARLMPQIPTILTTQYDHDNRNKFWNPALSGMYTPFPGVDHTLIQENKVDMLDIPGKGRCYVYIARYSYDPFTHSPNENPEAELAINAGEYILVWGHMDEDGFYDGELLDGRRGLVPSNFIQKLVGEDLLEFHQSVVLGLRDCDDSGSTNIGQDLDFLSNIQDMFPLDESMKHRFGMDYNYMDLEDILEEEDESLCEQTGEGPVPAPKQLTLERQLNKSVVIGWNHPPEAAPGAIDSYHVYVDGVLKTTVKATERPRALVEGVDSNRPHRISVRSVTPNRRTSRDAACTMVIGKDMPLGPTNVKATHVSSTSAVISWLPSNSNHQHVVCVNNVEVRTVKPGVYRHTITGLAPNTVYRVTVKAKNIRSPHFDEKSTQQAERLSCHIDFRTLPKGLPDPPVDIQVEPGPQDGTLLVTWLPVTINTSVHNAPVTGYAVYADGKKVTDVDSPTGDHALIDINKLVGLNPKQVTVRTKSRDSQSSDSLPTVIPPTALKGKLAKDNVEMMKDRRQRERYGSAMPPHMRHHQEMASHRNAHGQIIMDSEENLSDKEVYPSNHINIPSIEITKDSASEGNFSEDDYLDGRRGARGHHPHHDFRGGPRSHPERGRPQFLPHERGRLDHHSGARKDRIDERDQYYLDGRGDPRGRHGPHTSDRYRSGGISGGRGIPPHLQGPGGRDKRVRYFVALFDYDPHTMSPNPESCEEELPFSEGDTIKVYGDKDPDGFYVGECKGRRGYVPHNMVVEVQELPKNSMESTSRGHSHSRDRWGDIYTNMPVKKMIALYDYDPQKLSPNVDAEVELSFSTGDVIYVYGEMDDDGFYMGEIDGERGLVPSNFLIEAPPEYGNEHVRQRGPQDRSRGAHGSGVRGPPPPPRDGRMDPRERRKDACPVPSQLDYRTDGYHQGQSGPSRGRGEARGDRRGGRGGNWNRGPPPPGREPREMVGRPTEGEDHHQSQMQRRHEETGATATTPQPKPQAPTKPLKGIPAVVPDFVIPNKESPTVPSGPKFPETPNLMQRFTEMTGGADTSVDNIISKGKELIFMKFGLGK